MEYLAVHLIWSLRVNQYRQDGRFIPTSLIEKHKKEHTIHTFYTILIHSILVYGVISSKFHLLTWYLWWRYDDIHLLPQLTRCIFITTPFGLNLRSCLLSESGNATFRSHVQTTCISNWLIWKQKVCKTFLGSSRNISIIIVTKNSLKKVSWPIFWTKSVTL